MNIAVFRALQLGDLLCCIPAMRALRKACPRAEITLLGLPWAASLVKRFPAYFDRFVHFPGYPGLPEQESDTLALEAFMRDMRDERYDLLLQMQGNGTIVNPLLLTFGAVYTAGFHNEHSRVPSELFMEYPNFGHEIERHNRLMAHLGITSQGYDLEFPLDADDYKAFDELRLPAGPGEYVCVHPGSRGGWRQWPPRFFALLASYCIGVGYKIVVTGTEEERPITRELVKWIPYPVIDLTGRTTLGSAGVLIKNAAMLISNCTGVSHIAAAVRTPSVVISMDGEPGRWAPLNTQLHKTLDWTRQPDLMKALTYTADLVCAIQNDSFSYSPGSAHPPDGIARIVGHQQ